MEAANVIPVTTKKRGRPVGFKVKKNTPVKKVDAKPNYEAQGVVLDFDGLRIPGHLLRPLQKALNDLLK